ncbi:MAG: XRE family transcriptional regulator [Mangrovibacterium sp.]
MANLMMIRDLAAQKNITLKEIADDLGITPTGLSKIMRENSTKTSTLERIALKLKVPVSVFFGDYVEPQQVDQKSLALENVGYYYPGVNASAGLSFDTDNDGLERIPVSIPNWGNGLDFINVFGDSMYPKFQSGEIIGIKQMEFQYLNFGYTYVVEMQNGDVYLKYVRKGKDANHVILASENPHYEPTEFHIKYIKAFHQVKGVISKLTM